MVRRTDLIPIQFPPDWVGADEADAAGVASIDMPGPNAGQVLVIERIVVVTNSVLDSEARVYVVSPNQEQVTDADLRDGSSTGNLDTADFSRAIRIHAGRALRVRWTNMTVGAVARVTVQYFVGTFFTREAGQEAS